MNRRVVITGMGLVTPVGVGRQAFAERLLTGDGGVGPIRGFDPSPFHSRLAAEIDAFSPAGFIAPRSLRRMDRLSQTVTAAARMAVDDAGIDLRTIDRRRCGIVMGTAFGGTEVAVRFAETLFAEGPRWVNPILVPNTVMNAPAGHAAIELGLRGVNTTLNHREASAETAIAVAATQIRLGRADLLLAGGGDLLSPFLFTVLERFRALSPQDGGEEGARPFDRRRNGPTAGEGVGLLCLESLPSARLRGAAVYGEIAGWGMRSAPAPANDWPDDPAAMIGAMQTAMAMGGVDAGAIDTVSAAANGSINADRMEAKALDALFSDPSHPLITSVKGAIGENHASGGMRCAGLALSLHAGVVPPTLGLHDPITPLSVVRSAPRQADLAVGMINACASGGTCVSLLLKRIP